MANWKNRIVGYGEEAPEEFLANPDNWRIHPRFQQDALAGVLDEVGWVQNVSVNRTTGHLVDGHLRVTIADRNGEKMVPVTYVELTLEEEAKILATLDPIAKLAVADGEKVEELLGSFTTDNEAIEALLERLRNDADLWPDSINEPPLPPIDDPGAARDHVKVVVMLQNPEAEIEAKDGIRLLLENNPEWCGVID